LGYKLAEAVEGQIYSSQYQNSYSNPAWIGNRIGITNEILPPWVPIELENEKIKCWGREYTFENSPLPVKIFSSGEEILYSQIRIVSIKNQQREVWKSKLLSMIRSTDGTKAVVCGELMDRLGQKIRVISTIEYDGLILIEFMADRDFVDIEMLFLEVPIHSERATLRHRWAHSWDGISGYLPKNDGVVDKSSFIPYYWLGDNDRGIFWFCESDEMWPNASTTNAITIERNGIETTLRLTIVQSKQAFPNPWKFTIGLQATPVKPLPENWRNLRISPLEKPNIEILWPEPNETSFRYYGYPEAKNEVAFKNKINVYKAKAIKVIPYLCLTYLSTQSPEWKIYKDKWAMGYFDESSLDVKSYGASFSAIDPNLEDWQDFIIWKSISFINKFSLDGVYHDNTQLQKETKNKFNRFPILSYRRLYRRMYAALREKNRESLSIAHTSGKLTIPILAYEDAFLNGEQFRDRVKDNYLDVIGLDGFRAAFIGKQWGLVPIFLPEFNSDYAVMQKPTRGLMALLMIHDVIPWPIWCNVAEVNKALSYLYNFGYIKADFYPYYMKEPPAVSNKKNIYISAYKKKTGKWLFIAANLGASNLKASICLNKKLVDSPLRLKSLISNDYLKTDHNNCFDSDIESQSYQLFLVQQE
jgi:hypothetical protein